MATLEDYIVEHFRWREVLVDVIHRNNVKSLDDVPDQVKENLRKIAQAGKNVRNYLGIPFNCNSGYRPWSRGSAHQHGKAMDLQPTDQADMRLWPLQIFQRVLQTVEEGQGLMFGFQRAFWEWTRHSQGDGWLHIDLNHHGGTVNNPQLFIGYPIQSGRRTVMRYELWSGIYPWVKAGYDNPAYA